MTALPFDGVKVAVTGDVPGMSREQAWAAVRTLGGTHMASAGKSTGLLVVGAGAGKKVEVARGLGIRVVPADTFAALVADPGTWDGNPVGEVPHAPEAVAPRGPQVVPVHAPGIATGTFQGGSGSSDRTWGTRTWCGCGWKAQTRTPAEAEERKSAHVNDPTAGGAASGGEPA